jgi:hypothetical protein
MGYERFLDEVVALKPRLLDPRTRAAAEEVDRLLHEDFSEIGASGRRWDRVSTTAWRAA